MNTAFNHKDTEQTPVYNNFPKKYNFTNDR